MSEQPGSEHDIIWGKTPGDNAYPLRAHLLDAWLCAGAVWDHWARPGLRRLIADLIAGGDQDEARRRVQAAAGMHDIGKVNPVFQTQAGDTRDLSWRRQHMELLQRAGMTTPSPQLATVAATVGHPMRRHEYIGAITLAGGTPERLTLDEHWFTQATTGHHGRWHRARDRREMQSSRHMMDDPWLAAAAGIKESVLLAVGQPDLVARRALAGGGAMATILVTGLVVLADWIASSEQNVARGRSLLSAGTPPDGRWLQEREAELTESVKSLLGMYHAPVDAARTIMGPGAVMRPLQVEAAELGGAGGLWMSAYPTGEGKTSAALLRHTGREGEGLLFALPTRATTNAMQRRLDSTFANTSNQVVLSHQFAARHQCVTEGAGYGIEWFDSPVRRLVAPVVAATCDQVLAGALRGKHEALRLTALANKHVVLDEVHTFDHYQSSLLTELLHWWGATGTRVTLLSATLPAWQQQQFETAYRQERSPCNTTLAYPGSRLVNANGATVDSNAQLSARRQPLHTETSRVEDPVAAHVSWAVNLRKTRPGAHLAIVTNTVDRSIAVAQNLIRADTGADVICLHSRFTLQDRSRIENTITGRLGKDGPAGGPPVILVGTQVIEASLDIDVDFMSSDICPASGLLQRAGRCRRFTDPTRRLARLDGDGRPATLHIVSPTGSTLPYMKSEIGRVEQYLQGQPTISIPGDVQQFVDTTTMSLDAWQELLASPGGEAELGEVVKRLEEASRSKARIADDILSGRADHRSLAALTGKQPAELFEDLMGTRYIDRPGGTYLLTGPEHIARLEQSREACLHAVDVSIPVSAGIAAQLAPAVTKTLSDAGVDEWAPAHASLTFMPPLNSALLGDIGFIYDPQLGLRKEPSA